MAGILIGGAGAAMQLGQGGGASGDLAVGYDPADYLPPDRDAAASRASRDDARAAQAAEDTPAQDPSGPAGAQSDQPARNVAAEPAGSCAASFNDAVQATANGEVLNPGALTAAHKSLPFDSQVRVTNLATGQSIVVRINDRGPFVADRCLDLSPAAFDAIADLDAGVVSVRYEVLAEDAT